MPGPASSRRNPLVLLLALALSGSTLMPAMLAAQPAPAGELLAVTGTVAAVGDSGFHLTQEVAAQTLTVRVDRYTEWDGGLTGLGDLAPGLQVRVAGVSGIEGVVHARHVVGQLQPEVVHLPGTVGEVGATGFVLGTALGDQAVRVDSETVWGGSLRALGDVERGLQVSVSGVRQRDRSILAWRVDGHDEPPGEVLLTGTIDSVDAAGFLLRAVERGGAVVVVTVSARTVWGGSIGGHGDLMAGLRVAALGEEQANGTFLARQVWGREEPVVTRIAVVGTVASLGWGSFVLIPERTGAAAMTMNIDEQTAWGGSLAGPDDLQPGLRLYVTGESQADSSVLARQVTGLEQTPGTAVLLSGEVESVQAGGFVFLPRDRHDPHTVTVSALTRWSGGLTGLADLGHGDLVHVVGEERDGTVAAAAVWLAGGGNRGGDFCGVRFQSRGQITALRPPSVFALSDGRAYQVDESTVYDPAVRGYSGLAEGQFLLLEAVRQRDRSNLVQMISYQGDGGTGQGRTEVAGTVASTDATRIALIDGTVLLHDESTLWQGDADQWWNLEAGWQVQAVAFRRLDEQLLALTVRADDPRPATTGDQEYEPRQALVLLHEGADPALVAAAHGAEVIDQVGSLASLFAWSRDLDDGLLASLEADPQVRAVEPNYRFRDPESVRRRYVIVDRRGDPAKHAQQPANTLVNSGGELPVSDSQIVVALLDTGVDPAHSFLAGSIAAAGLDLVDGDTQPWEERNGLDDDGDGDVDEAAGHGTFVASLITLVAPDARILPYRVLDDDGGGTAFALAMALVDALAQGVDVVNLSLEYHERSQLVDELLELAAAQGVVVIAAAGNDSDTTLPFPASDSNVIAVTGCDASGQALASFANRSALVVMAAPSVEVYGAVDGERWGTWSGTSFAAPFVSATVALLLTADPELDPFLVRQTLEQAGTPLDDDTWRGNLLDIGLSIALLNGTADQDLRQGPTRRVGGTDE